MMLVVLAVTTATVYLAEKNRRSNQQQLLDAQFQNRVQSFLKIQAAQSEAITEKCLALSHSVRLRAALEERDVDDLYQNALTELEEMLDRTGASPDATRASFFRFFDGDGLILSPENHPAGLTDQPALQEALSRMAKGLREDDEQVYDLLPRTVAADALVPIDVRVAPKGQERLPRDLCEVALGSGRSR